MKANDRLHVFVKEVRIRDPACTFFSREQHLLFLTYLKQSLKHGHVIEISRHYDFFRGRYIVFQVKIYLFFYLHIIFKLLESLDVHV